MKEEANWAKKVGLAQIKKLNWTLVDELVVKEMVYSYNHVSPYVKLKGRQIDVGKEEATIIFSPSHERLYQLEEKATILLLQPISLEMNMNITYCTQDT